MIRVSFFFLLIHTESIPCTPTVTCSDSTEKPSRKPSKYSRRTTSSLSRERPGLLLGHDRVEIDVESDEEEEEEEEGEGELAAALTSQRPRGKLVRSVGGSFAEEELELLAGSRNKVEAEGLSTALLAGEYSDDAIEGDAYSASSQRPRGKLVRSVGGSFAEEELDKLRAHQSDAVAGQPMKEDDGKMMNEHAAIEKLSDEKTQDEHFEDLQPYEVLADDADAKTVVKEESEFVESAYEVVAVESEGGIMTKESVSLKNAQRMTTSENLNQQENVTIYDAVPLENEPANALTAETVARNNIGQEESKSESYFDVVVIENKTVCFDDDEAYENVSIKSSVLPNQSVDKHGSKTVEEKVEMVTLDQDDKIVEVKVKSLEEALIEKPITQHIENLKDGSTIISIACQENETNSTDQPLTKVPKMQPMASPIDSKEQIMQTESLIAQYSPSEKVAVLLTESQKPVMVDEVRKEPLPKEEQIIEIQETTVENSMTPSSHKEPLPNKEQLIKVQETTVENSIPPSIPSIIAADNNDDALQKKTSTTEEASEVSPSSVLPLLSVAQRQMQKYSSTTSIASEEEEEAKTFESHFETMSEEAETILQKEPVADMVKVLDSSKVPPKSTPSASEKYSAKNRSTASSLACEEEEEAVTYQGYFETVAEEAQSLMEAKNVAPIVAGLGRGTESTATIYQNLLPKDSSKTKEGSPNSLAETLDSIQSEEERLEDVLDIKEEMDDWRPKGIERRRGEELPTPYLVEKKKEIKTEGGDENESSEFEEHERQLDQLSNSINKIIAPLADNELLDHEEELLRVST